jgi:ubiquinone/menaquinone biosynthesis C-methylase UbiE
MMSELNPHETANRAYWDAQSDRYQERHGEQLINSGRNAWGLWQRAESELDVLGEVAGRDVLEFGCGAAQWSIALAERGARTTGLDLSERQLAHARELMLAAGVDFPLVCASAEATPFDDRSFDIVFCDWGAMTFADPYRTVPEAARVLREGGLFAFCGCAPIVDCAWAPGADHPGDRLVVDYFGMHALHEPDGSVSFQLPYGEWIRLFHEHGFAIETLLELRPGADAQSSYRDESDRAWARRWPMEHIWRLRRTG